MIDRDGTFHYSVIKNENTGLGAETVIDDEELNIYGDSFEADLFWEFLEDLYYAKVGDESYGSVDEELRKEIDRLAPDFVRQILTIGFIKDRASIDANEVNNIIAKLSTFEDFTKGFENLIEREHEI